MDHTLSRRALEMLGAMFGPDSKYSIPAGFGRQAAEVEDFAKAALAEHDAADAAQKAATDALEAERKAAETAADAEKERTKVALFGQPGKAKKKH